MADKKIFKTENIVASAAGSPKSMFEELNLPPRVEDFLRTWHKPAIGLLLAVIVAVLGFSFSKQYISSRSDKATEQLAQAMKLDDQIAKESALTEVASSYRRTGAGIWSRIELAHLERNAGNLPRAAAAYEELLESMPRRDTRLPMVRLSLAQVLTELGEYDRAADLFRGLANTAGFEAWGLLGEGELLDRQGDKAAARERYRQLVQLENAPALLLEQAEYRLNN